ncbi:hypothetical protein NEFER03_1996 [Nematocida sp. LUAm3]|nr:hypothetical protein NEFER03_1996 [Nematocida sp. LUAm3]KAI5176080.1 hypothetical protein NEFER02_1914 [Nematocida sp. LUAm2]KAI5177124.1 hypothetical protein NEFER01_0399 [Nematocida sp. LUAm1]
MSSTIATSKQKKFIDFTEEIKRSFVCKINPNPRTKLLLWQLEKLEEVYKEDTHPSQKTKRTLAEESCLSIKTVQIWFQNKRAKEKSRRDSGIESEPEEYISAIDSTFYSNDSNDFSLEKENSITEKNLSFFHNEAPTESSKAPNARSIVFYSPPHTTHTKNTPQTKNTPRTEHNSFEKNFFTYDEFYSELSSIADIQDYSLLREHALEDIENPSPLMPPKFSKNTEEYTPISLSSMSSLMTHTDNKKSRFRNKSIIYNNEEEWSSFFDNVLNHKNSMK